MQTTRKTTSTNYVNELVLSAACPVNDALARLAMRWKMQVLYSVSRGDDSFGALARRLPSVSAHVLARRLGELVRERLLEKHPRPSRRVGYSVTARGEQLLEIVRAICAWEVEGRLS